MLNKKKLKKLISNSLKKKPLFEKNHSFSNRVTGRKFNFNFQKFTIEGKKYKLPVKFFRTYLNALKKTT